MVSKSVFILYNVKFLPFHVDSVIFAIYLCLPEKLFHAMTLWVVKLFFIFAEIDVTYQEYYGDES